MNVLSYFGWDVYCLRKQRDQVSACSFVLFRCTRFVLLRCTLSTERIAEVHEIPLHSITGGWDGPLCCRSFKDTPLSQHTTGGWGPWYQVWLCCWVGWTTKGWAHTADTGVGPGKFKCSFQVCHRLRVTVAALPVPCFQRCLLLPAL